MQIQFTGIAKFRSPCRWRKSDRHAIFVLLNLRITIRSANRRPSQSLADRDRKRRPLWPDFSGLIYAQTEHIWRKRRETTDADRSNPWTRRFGTGCNHPLAQAAHQAPGRPDADASDPVAGVDARGRARHGASL